jgi:sigma-B regulation protein RsbU (phosphoserine phosphatase)
LGKQRDIEAVEYLACLAREFNSTLELDEVLSNVATGIRRYVDHDTFAILLLDDLGEQLAFRFATGYSEDVVRNWRFGLGQGLVGTAAASQQVVRVNDVRKDTRYISADPKMRSELAIPLIAKNRTIGVLDVGSRRADHFTETHQQLLEFLAGHLANGIENARLYKSVLEQARMLSLMHEVSRDLTSILDREELLRKIAELVKRLIDYQLFSVMLWNEETQLLENTFMLRFDERFREKGGFPLGHGVTGTVAALRQPMRVPNVHLNPHYANCGHSVEVRSELAVPLIFKDRLIGVLDLESTEYNAFSQQHQQMLSTLGSYVAVALENARLYEKVIENEQRLECDLTTAREIQRGLLPDSGPDTPGLDVGFVYEPARELGGDFFEFLPYGEDRLAFAVGDAAGKGAAAALYGSLAIGILRGQVVKQAFDPAIMLAQVNRQLHKPRIENRFVAMTFGIFDARDRSLHLANAGFTRPVLVRRGKSEQLQIEGVPLGLLPDSDYEDMKLNLESGDMLVFCSDGIHEAMNKCSEEFGMRRLQSLLIEIADRPAMEIASELLHSTDLYIADGKASKDDRTVVVLKVR